MKKIFKMMFAVVAGVAALTACTNEPEEGVTPTPEAQGFTVVASMDDATKATFTDSEGLKWSVGDVLCALSPIGAINANGLVGENIVDNKATFTFNTIPTGDVYFSLNHNANAYTKHEYMFKSEITQSAAGGIDHSLIKLLGDKVTLEGTEESVTVKMNLVGTMMRFLVYSSTGKYKNENILSVKLVGNENFSGNGAVIGINHELGGYLQENNTNNVGENAVIFWDCSANYINVSLNVPAALNATNAEGCIGKGVYMPVPPISLSGYKYVVTTDAHQFTFDASTTAVTFANNVVKNVLLDVEKATSVESYNANNKGALTWEESLAENVALGAAAVTDQNIGYIFVKTQDNGSSSWQKRDKNATNAVYYEGIKFETSADWLTVGFAENNDNILVDAEANTTTEERTATLTVTFADANGYLVDEANKSFTVTFTQAAAGSAKVIKLNTSAGLPLNFTISHESLQNISVSEVFDEVAGAKIGNCWLVLEVDGTKLEGDTYWGKEETNTVYKSVDFYCHQTLNADPVRADWISISYPTDASGNINNAWPIIKVEANTTGVQRQSLVQVLLTVPEGYIFNGKEAGETATLLGNFEITQKAYSATIAASWTGAIYSDEVSYEGEDITVGTLNVTADGAAVANAADFCKVTISGGASVAVAADGTITATIPANASNSEKEYTVTIKDNSGNNLVDDVVIKQEANPEGGEVVESPFSEYSWEVSLVGGRAWGSAWGFGYDNANTQTGHYLTVSSIKHNGTTVNFTNTAADLELAQSIAEYAFRTSSPTDDEKATYDQSAKTGSQFGIKAFYCHGDSMQIAWILTGNKTISKTTGYDANGNELGSVIVWVE